VAVGPFQDRVRAVAVPLRRAAAIEVVVDLGGGADHAAERETLKVRSMPSNSVTGSKDFISRGNQAVRRSRGVSSDSAAI
jgi:hypothetical protein